MSDAAWELQQAVYSALTNSGAIALTVYDHIPNDTKADYIRVDEPGTADWDVSPAESDDGYGKEHTFMVHIWSSYEGKKQLNLVMREIELELRDFAPALNGHNLVNMRLQFVDRVSDEGDHSHHGVMQFRAITEEVI